MEKIHVVNGKSVDVERRQESRNNLEMMTALFQRDVLGLVDRSLDTFHSICQKQNIEGDTVEELVAGLVQKYQSITHPKHRGKLQHAVSSAKSAERV